MVPTILINDYQFVMKSVEVLKAKLQDWKSKGVDVLHLITADNLYLYFDVQADNLDSTVGLGLFFNLNESYDFESCTYTAIREVWLDGDELLFNLEDIRQTMDGDYEDPTISRELKYYRNQTIQDFQNRYDDKEIEMRIDAIIEYIDTYPIKCQLIANTRGDLIDENDLKSFE